MHTKWRHKTFSGNETQPSVMIMIKLAARCICTVILHLTVIHFNSKGSD